MLSEICGEETSVCVAVGIGCDAIMKSLFSSFLALAAIAAPAHATMMITEWMYGGTTEFIEFTNTGSTAVDMTGWSYYDSGRIAGAVSLSGFGIVQPGQSVILTDVSETVFRDEWNTPTIAVIGGNTINLGRGDEINLYDNLNVLVDRLTYDDQLTGTVKGPRTNGTSGITAPTNYGANNASLWQLSSLSDGFSWAADSGNIGNPGIAAGTAPVPEASTSILLGAAGLAMAFRRRRK